MISRSRVTTAAFLSLVVCSSVGAASEKPNIVLVLTDDLGYGDVAFLNPDCKIPTPQMDALSQEGVYLTDAHSPSSVCTPTRYSILSGNYAWRNRATASGVLLPWDEPAFAKDDTTIATLLRQSGYATACIGKWHLGFEWPWREGFSKKMARKGGHSIASCEMFDFSKPITGGPTDHGFAYYFGDDVPNFPPYAYIENGRLTCEPVDIDEKKIKSIGSRGSIHGKGPGEEGWTFEQVLPSITQKAVKYIEERSRKKDPFFLCFMPTSPHTPVVPSKAFQDKSKAGPYGDFVMQTDDSIGQLVRALKEKNLFDNTLLIVTSDNGPSPTSQKAIPTYNHRPTGSLRGMKFDTWEGGHRVPFIASWPRRGIQGGGKVDHTLVLTDLYATFAVAAGIQPPKGNDSQDQTSTLLGNGATRNELVSHSGKRLALRQNEWVLLVGGGGKKEPEWRRKIHQIESEDSPVQLFNLAEDIGQRVNVADKYPKRVKEMTARLNAMKQGAR